jgi:hypothetical protein
MFVTYFFEGLIVGSLLGLLLRPILEYYVVWHRGRALENQDEHAIRVDLSRPTEAPKRTSNGAGPDGVRAAHGRSSPRFDRS